MGRRVAARCTPGSARAFARGSTDAGAAASSTRCSTRARSCPTTTPARGRRLRLPGLGAVGQLGDGAAARGDRRAPRPDAVRDAAPAAAADRVARPAGRSAGGCSTSSRDPRGPGSNEWVVAGSRTASGKPLLANDPHLLALQPGAWLEMHLRAPGYEARGVALTFSPGIAARRDGASRVGRHERDRRRPGPLRRAPERRRHGRRCSTAPGIRSRCTGRRSASAEKAEPDILEVRETRHGPILDACLVGVHASGVHRARPRPRRTRLRWTGFDVGIRPSLVLDAAHGHRASRSSAEAVCGRGVPRPELRLRRRRRHDRLSVHRRYPRPARRRRNRTGSGVDRRATSGTGGSRSRSCPGRRIPSADTWSPRTNRIHDEAYPHLIGKDFHAPYRARRVVERLEAARRTTSRRWRGSSSTRSRSPRGRRSRG